MSSSRRAGALLGFALLGLQVATFARARLTDDRYFCWAPFHSASRYVIDARVGDRVLGDAEIAERYALAGLYWDPSTRTNWELNAITHIFDRVRATEATAPEGSRASVTISYSTNGRAPVTWSSP